MNISSQREPSREKREGTTTPLDVKDREWRREERDETQLAICIFRIVILKKFLQLVEFLIQIR